MIPAEIVWGMDECNYPDSLLRLSEWLSPMPDKQTAKVGLVIFQCCPAGVLGPILHIACVAPVSMLSIRYQNPGHVGKGSEPGHIFKHPAAFTRLGVFKCARSL